MYRAKQTMFEPLYARNFQKRKNKSQKHNLVSNWEHMAMVFDSNLFDTIIYSKYDCEPSFVPNKPSLNHFIRESFKIA